MKLRKLAIWAVTAAMFCSMPNISMAAQAKVGTTATKEKLKKAYSSKYGMNTSTKEKMEYEKNEVIVYMEHENGLAGTSLKQNLPKDMTIKKSWNFKDSGAKGKDGIVALISSEGTDTKKMLQTIKKIKGVMYVSPNYKGKFSSVSADMYADYQWGLKNEGGFTGKAGNDINVTKAWEDETYKKSQSDPSRKEPVVAVVDTGIDFTNPDVKDCIWTNTHLSKLSGLHGYDFGCGDTNPQDDVLSHGTHVSGIIAASVNNGIGVAGETKNVKIMPLKVADEGGGLEVSAAIAAYHYIYRAQQLGVNIVAINNSWGISANKEELCIWQKIIDAVGKNGAITVTASGNDTHNMDEHYMPYGEFDAPGDIGADETPAGTQVYDLPSDIRGKYSVSVAATEANGELASYSNYGKNSVDIAAPGTAILSTVNAGCFNPGIYTPSKKRETCMYYQDFDGNGFGQVAEEPLYYIQPKLSGVRNSKQPSSSTTFSANVEYGGFGKTGSKALKIRSGAMKAGDRYVVAFPYQYQKSWKDGETYISFMENAKAFNNTEKSQNYFVNFYDAPVNDDKSINMSEAVLLGCVWDMKEANSMINHFWGCNSFDIDKSEKRAIVIDVEAKRTGAIADVTIDDIGVSNAVEEKDVDATFEKYDYYNGTSMAAPFVTGALAILSETNPDFSPEKRRDAVCGMAVQEPSYKDKICNGARMTFDKLNHFNPIINELKVKQGKLCISGDFFGEQPGKLMVDGTEIANADVTWKDSQIIINKAMNFDKTTDVVVETKEGTGEKSEYVYSGENVSVKDNFANNLCALGDLTSDGTTMYSVSKSGAVYGYKPGDKTGWKYLGEMSTENIFTSKNNLVGDIDGSLQIVSKPVYQNGEIYALVTNDKGYEKDTVLAAYNVSSGTSSKVANLPDTEDRQGVIQYSLGMYQGDFYLVGGYDTRKKEAIKDVYVLSEQECLKGAEKAVWKKSVDLPEGRYLSLLCQDRERLYAVLGGNTKDEVPKTCVFDGTKWTMLSEELKPVQEQGKVDWKFDKEKHVYYTAAVGTLKNGIILSGVTFKDFGNIVMLVDEGSGCHYKKTGYVQDGVLETEMVTGVVNDGKYYMMSLSDLSIPEFSYIPVENTNVVIKDQSDAKFATVIGAGQYLPGQTVTLTAKVVKKGYHFSYMLVNGKKNKQTTVTIKTEKDITVKVVVAKDKKKKTDKKTNTTKK